MVMLLPDTQANKKTTLNHANKDHFLISEINVKNKEGNQILLSSVEFVLMTLGVRRSCALMMTLVQKMFLVGRGQTLSCPLP
jgi:NADH:ubiquinone oxidoreductase subunit H